MKKRMKKLVAAIVLTIIIAVGILPIKSSAAFDTGVRDGVCVVLGILVDAETGVIYDGGQGSGFFIGDPGSNPEYLITNHHVIDTYLTYGKGEKWQAELTDGRTVYVRASIRVYFSSVEYVEARVIDSDDIADVAVLRLSAPTDQRKALPLHEVSDSEIGSSVYCVGYPGVAENFYIESNSKWNKEDASVTSGTVSRLITLKGTAVKAIQTDAQINHGNSGGPMVNDNAEVIGINSWGVNVDGEAENYAVDISEVTAMLNRNNISYSTTGGNNNSNPGGEDGTETDTTTPPAPEKKGMSTGLLIGIILGALVLIAGVVVLIIVLSKKGSSAPAPAPQPAPAPMGGGATMAAPRPAPQPSKRPMLRSLSTQHGGSTFPVGNTPVMIGRDASSCAIVFREGTAGVSGRHCQVAFDAASNSFVVTDLRSSYGTFLMNGTRLPANAPYKLQPGDSFYVGDKQNVIRTELG